jgi:hypothetical protein
MKASKQSEMAAAKKKDLELESNKAKESLAIAASRSALADAIFATARSNETIAHDAINKEAASLEEERQIRMKTDCALLKQDERMLPSEADYSHTLRSTKRESVRPSAGALAGGEPQVETRVKVMDMPMRMSDLGIQLATEIKQQEEKKQKKHAAAAAVPAAAVPAAEAAVPQVMGINADVGQAAAVKRKVKK